MTERAIADRGGPAPKAPLHVLVLWAHPLEDSFNARLCRTVVDCLERRGHTVDCHDLYREGFRAVMTAGERLAYHDPSRNRATVAAEVERLRRAQALVMVYPTWNFGVPAILKGYLERVLIPGVAFHMADGHTFAGLTHVRRLAFVTTYGATRLVVKGLVGDPVRKVMLRGLRRLCARDADARWLALYNMNRPSARRCERFVRRVESALATW